MASLEQANQCQFAKFGNNVQIIIMGKTVMSVTLMAGAASTAVSEEPVMTVTADNADTVSEKNTSASSGRSFVEDLERLAGLYKEGFLTEAEFEAAKSTLFGFHE